MSWRIIKRLGEQWDVVRDGAMMSLESLTYRIWLEGDSVRSSVAWQTPRLSAVSGWQTENPADAWVDIQTATHRLLGQGAQTRLFGRSPDTGEPHVIGLAREIEVSANHSLPDLFTVRVSFWGVSHGQGPMWPTETTGAIIEQTFKRLNRYELLLKGSDDDGQGTAEPDRPA